MTVVEINPGICGFVTTISASRKTRDSVKIEIRTKCESVQKFAGQIEEIDWKDALTCIDRSIIYREAAKAIKHASCPVPFAVLKAIEVEIGVALPRSVVLEFSQT